MRWPNPRDLAPDFLQHAVESLKGKLAAVLREPVIHKHVGGFQVSGNKHRVPGNVHGLVHKGRWALKPRCHHLPLGSQFCRDDIVGVASQSLRYFFEPSRDPQHVFGWIVVHLAVSFHVVIEFDDASFFGCQDGANFIKRPSKVVPIIVQRIIGILAGVKAAVFPVGQDFHHPTDDAFGCFVQRTLPNHAFHLVETRADNFSAAPNCRSTFSRSAGRASVHPRNSDENRRRADRKRRREPSFRASSRSWPADAFLSFADSAREPNRSRKSAETSARGQSRHS